MWSEISEPWKVCFEEAWEAYCNGSIPIGAVIVSSDGEIISRGRNMINETTKELRRLSGSKIAHAEMNAIYSSKQGLRNAIIYSTMEPCIMCFGTIVMSGIKEIYYAARDGVAGGVNLKNDYIKKRNIAINEYNPKLEIVQLVIKTDFIYRNFGDRAGELLSVWEETCPLGIQLGKQWYKENRLVKYKEAKYTIEQVSEEISKELTKI
jgi:tRNA(adenine34) deaminase